MFPLRDNVRSRTFPFVNYLIVAANAAAFYQQLKLNAAGALESYLREYALIPALFLADPLAGLPSVVSSMFLHGSWGHIVGNMWFLLIFGDNVEDAVGHVRYVFFYLLTGFGAAMAQVAASPASSLPMIGASGAIAGVLGAYFFLYPKARVLALVPVFMFLRIVEIPAFFFLGIWFLMQAVNGVGALSAEAIRGEMGGVAWWAHAGGFVAGLAFILVFRRRR